MSRPSDPVRKLPGLASRLARRLHQVGPSGWALLLQTFCLLLAAKSALRFLAVRKVIAWTRRPTPDPRAVTPADLRRIRHAVLVVARYSPVRFVCFPQCL